MVSRFWKKMDPPIKPWASPCIRVLKINHRSVKYLYKRIFNEYQDNAYSIPNYIGTYTICQIELTLTPGLNVVNVDKYFCTPGLNNDTFKPLNAY